ncbi:probable transmembrane ascorbate ferrireductase 4 isoform X3 [Malania oleifera]|uniref:probable transmembrane ascorbate ferrireductase 4 isoform X3 n=1 Tax=Malania oleifera TaxID=397392 RepID=UPI0025ADBE80|nr:probable transmembrane ascorbate ferrireductase 4 isoform X3 [Malania oleifera]
MASPTPLTSSLLPLLVLARISALLVALLLLCWSLAFRSSFLPQYSSQEGLIYPLLHPLLMVIGFILVSGEAILVHRWPPGSRNLRKSVHLCLQGVALASGVFGIWTKFHHEDGVVANFYSLHSWMGLICVFLFGAQWGWGRNSGPIHVISIVDINWKASKPHYCVNYIMSSMDKFVALWDMVSFSLGVPSPLLARMISFPILFPFSHVTMICFTL